MAQLLRVMLVGGRQRATTPREDRFSVMQARRHPFVNTTTLRNVWNMLQVAISGRPVQPTTLVELGNALTDEWNNLEMAAIQRLTGSMRRRCQAGIASRGSHTSY